MSGHARPATETAAWSRTQTLGIVVAVTLAVAVVSYVLAFGLVDQLVDGAGIVAYGLGLLVVAGCGWRVAERGRVPRAVGAVVGLVVALLVAVAVTIVAFLASPCPGVGC